MKCVIRMWAEPDPIFGFDGSGIVIAKGHCETHGWGFTGGCTAQACPVGIIEQAIEDSTKRILDAIKEGK